MTPTRMEPATFRLVILVRNFIVYHTNCVGKVSFIAYFSDCVLVILPDDGRIQQTKHVAEK